MSYDNACNNPLALCKTTIKEQFWLDDPTELYKNNNYTKFFPKYEMTRTQQLNAVTRFALYMIILILAFNRGETILVIPICILIVAVMIKKFNKDDLFGKEKEVDKILKIRQNKENYINTLKNKEYSHDGDKIYKTSIEMEEEDEQLKDYTLQSGSYDPDGKLNLGNKEKVNNYLRDSEPSLYSVDELIDYNKNTCRRPTPNNPFMNPAAVEFGNGDPPAACNAEDDEIKDNIKVNFNHQLFRDVDELWERENSQRQFYTIPNTAIPNNQKEFAEWLYKLPSSANCKESQEGCLRYDPLRVRIR
ncbi:hypothetical protein QKU48_gp0518 [Fadolivirus algeromassiliense]|jgi:hypothetical protein|uniref:Minor capsid protein P9 transmembrane helices domain-containing protein n=1 Tax=Fadolivirus FV1/VV64 TaxID=3070911 RepID=A0A7D3V7K2_9VIRU|nr:hypothetical protein QKU48_gp0518 [Fadolivirus algeromassiliense]QKF93976.1 hypothetical protein Fadolivirus_1_518 [Fadolivirus FV1/VV64]